MEVIILCKTKVKQSFEVENMSWYKQYAMKIDDDGYTSMRRKINLVEDIKYFQGWEILDTCQHIEDCLMCFGDSDYWQAESLSAYHERAVEKDNTRKAINKEIAELRYQLENGGLKEKYNNLYTQELKDKKVYSKAKKGIADNNVIMPLQAKLTSQFQAEKAEIEKNLQSLYDQMAEL